MELRRLSAGAAAVVVMLAPLASTAASASTDRRGPEGTYTPDHLDEKFLKGASGDYSR